MPNILIIEKYSRIITIIKRYNRIWKYYDNRGCPRENTIEIRYNIILENEENYPFDIKLVLEKSNNQEEDVHKFLPNFYYQWNKEIEPKYGNSTYKNRDINSDRVLKNVNSDILDENISLTQKNNISQSFTNNSILENVKGEEKKNENISSTMKNDNYHNRNKTIYSSDEKENNSINDLFPKDFDDYINKSKKITHPIQNSKYIKTKENLKIYQYIEDIKIKNEKLITILFVGETGSGKSTLINAFLNYLLGILKTYDFRYEIVKVFENDDKTQSQTKEINTYFIRSPLYPGLIFRFIDTPGFADTKNEENEKEREISEKIMKFLGKFIDNEELLNAICFIVKYSTTRFNKYQKEIFSNVTKLFATDVKDNFITLFTFYMGSKISAKEIMTKLDVFKEKEKEKKIGIGLLIKKFIF